MSNRGHIAGTILALVSCCLVDGRAMSATVQFDEDRIVSLANAPELSAVDGYIDDAARPVLNMTLRYANSCYAQAGIRVVTAKTESGPGHAIVLQSFPDGGCPDIFQPVDQTATVLLPSDWGGAAVRVVAKPAQGQPYKEVSMSAGNSAGTGFVVESEPLGDGAWIPYFEVNDASGMASSAGYTITGKLAAGRACNAEQAELTVFEVPDTDGEPSFHVLVFSMQGKCGQPAGSTDFALSVDLPRGVKKKTVYVINEREAGMRRID